jgi:hypothetical protein
VERFILTHRPVVFASVRVDPLSKKLYAWAGVPHGEGGHALVALRQAMARQVPGRVEDLVILEGVSGPDIPIPEPKEKLPRVSKSNQRT